MLEMKERREVQSGQSETRISTQDHLTPGPSLGTAIMEDAGEAFSTVPGTQQALSKCHDCWGKY